MTPPPSTHYRPNKSVVVGVLAQARLGTRNTHSKFPRFKKLPKKIFPDLAFRKLFRLLRNDKMKLTTKKLESLILEIINPEQEKKIYNLIEKSRQLLIKLQNIQNFFPPVIEWTYSYGEDELVPSLKDFTSGPRTRKMINRHYTATEEIIKILEELNQYLVLLEDLQIEGNLAWIAKGMLFSGVVVFGPIAVDPQQQIKIRDLWPTMNRAIKFLEDVQNSIPGYFGQGNINFEAWKEIAESFHYNHNSLNNYLDSTK